jgi:hypothetical protein
MINNASGEISTSDPSDSCGAGYRMLSSAFKKPQARASPAMGLSIRIILEMGAEGSTV